MDRLIDEAIAQAEEHGEIRGQEGETAELLALDPRPFAPPQQLQEAASASLLEQLRAADAARTEEGEEQEKGDEDVEDEDDDLSSNCGYDEFDYVRMGLTDEEREWALSIKEIADSSPDLRRHPLSDMMIAQIALVSLEEGEEGDREKARERIENLQAVRDNYEIVDTLETGKDIVRRVVLDLLPGFVLSFYLHPSHASYVLVTDLTSFDMSIFDDPDKLLLWLKACYYITHCQNPDLSAVRNGIIYLQECQGYYWKGMSMFQPRGVQEWSDLVAGYPAHFRCIMNFHTGLFLNLLASAGKRLLPPRIAPKIVLGCISEHGTLDKLYLQPSLEVANQRLMQKLDQALELRYGNEASFSL